MLTRASSALAVSARSAHRHMEAASLFTSLQAASGLHGRHAVLRRRDAAVAGLLRSFDADADGVLTRQEAALCIDELARAQAVARGADPAGSGEVARAVASTLTMQRGGYAVTEVGRAVRCGLFLNPELFAAAAPSAAAAARAADVDAAATALFRQLHAQADMHGRQRVLRREQGTISALLRAFGSGADGMLSAGQAERFFATLLAAEAAARGSPAAEPAGVGGARLLAKAAPAHVASGGGYTAREVLRVARAELLMTSQGVPGAQQPRAGNAVGYLSFAAAAEELARELRLAGDIHGRHRVLQSGSLRAFVRAFDADSDGILSAAEAEACATTLLAAADATAAPGSPPAPRHAATAAAAAEAASAGAGGVAAGDLCRVLRCELIAGTEPVAEVLVSEDPHVMVLVQQPAARPLTAAQA